MVSKVLWSSLGIVALTFACATKKKAKTPADMGNAASTNDASYAATEDPPIIPEPAPDMSALMIDDAKLVVDAQAGKDIGIGGVLVSYPLPDEATHMEVTACNAAGACSPDAKNPASIGDDSVFIARVGDKGNAAQKLTVKVKLCHFQSEMCGETVTRTVDTVATTDMGLADRLFAQFLNGQDAWASAAVLIAAAKALPGKKDPGTEILEKSEPGTVVACIQGEICDLANDTPVATETPTTATPDEPKTPPTHGPDQPPSCEEDGTCTTGNPGPGGPSGAGGGGGTTTGTETPADQCVTDPSSCEKLDCSAKDVLDRPEACTVVGSGELVPQGADSVTSTGSTASGGLSGGEIAAIAAGSGVGALAIIGGGLYAAYKKGLLAKAWGKKTPEEVKTAFTKVAEAVPAKVDAAGEKTAVNKLRAALAQFPSAASAAAAHAAEAVGKTGSDLAKYSTAQVLRQYRKLNAWRGDPVAQMEVEKESLERQIKTLEVLRYDRSEIGRANETLRQVRLNKARTDLEEAQTELKKMNDASVQEKTSKLTEKYAASLGTKEVVALQERIRDAKKGLSVLLDAEQAVARTTEQMGRAISSNAIQDVNESMKWLQGLKDKQDQTRRELAKILGAPADATRETLEAIHAKNIEKNARFNAMVEAIGNPYKFKVSEFLDVLTMRSVREWAKIRPSVAAEVLANKAAKGMGDLREAAVKEKSKKAAQGVLDGMQRVGSAVAGASRNAWGRLATRFGARDVVQLNPAMLAKSRSPIQKKSLMTKSLNNLTVWAKSDWDLSKYSLRKPGGQAYDLGKLNKGKTVAAGVAAIVVVGAAAATAASLSLTEENDFDLRAWSALLNANATFLMATMDEQALLADDFVNNLK